MEGSLFIAMVLNSQPRGWAIGLSCCWYAELVIKRKIWHGTRTKVWSKQKEQGEGEAGTFEHLSVSHHLWLRWPSHCNSCCFSSTPKYWANFLLANSDLEVNGERDSGKFIFSSVKLIHKSTKVEPYDRWFYEIYFQISSVDKFQNHNVPSHVNLMFSDTF